MILISSSSAKKVIKQILISDPDERITIEKIKRTSFYQKGHQLFDIAHKNFTINNSTGFSFNKYIASPCHAHTSSRDNNESVMKKTVNSLRKKVLSIEDSVVKENYTLHVKKNTMINNTTNSTDVAFSNVDPNKETSEDNSI